MSTDLAIFTPTLEGGIGRVITNLAIGFNKKGWLVDLISVSASSPYLKELPASVKVIDFRLNRTSKSLLKLTTFLRKTKPKILLSVSYHANIIALWAKLLARVETKVFISEHTVLKRALNNLNPLKRFIICLFINFFYPLADGIISVSNDAAEDIIKITKLSRDKVRVIYNPVVTSKLYKYSEEPIDERFNTVFNSGLPIILGAGRLTREKDFQTLIKAFSLVKKRINSKLLILGEGEEGPILEKLINKSNLKGDVLLPGFVTNPYPFFKKANVFVLSSVWEGLPTVLIEAMALGVPVVSIDCPGGAREILENGKHGKLALIGDINTLAGAIVETLNNPPDPKLSKLRAKDFSVEKSVKEYRKIFQEIL